MKNEDIPLGYHEEWDGILSLAKGTQWHAQRLLIAEKSSQPLHSFKPEMSFEKKSENISGGPGIYSTSVNNLFA